MKNRNILLATIDVLLTLFMVVVGYMAVVSSNDFRKSEDTISEVLPFDIVKDFPSDEKRKLTFIALKVSGNVIEAYDFEQGKVIESEVFHSSKKSFPWLMSLESKLPSGDRKKIIVYESERNDSYVMDLIRFSQRNDIIISYVDADGF